MNLAKLPEILLKLSMAAVESAVAGNPLPLAAKLSELAVKGLLRQPKSSWRAGKLPSS
jgi:hypothetical protein